MSCAAAAWATASGMSQYGAYGYAQHAWSYGDILHHYYTGTSIRKTSVKRVRVLLQASRSSVRFRGASRLAGVRALDKRKTYTVRPLGRAARALPRPKAQGPLPRCCASTAAGGTVRLLGRAINGIRNGRYHGSLDLRPGASGGVTAINRIKLDQYVLGVVAGEMPSSWDAEALKAQAVAARTYALATRKHGERVRPLPGHPLAGLPGRRRRDLAQQPRRCARRRGRS